MHDSRLALDLSRSCDASPQVCQSLLPSSMFSGLLVLSPTDGDCWSTNLQYWRREPKLSAADNHLFSDRSSQSLAEGRLGLTPGTSIN